MGPKYKLALRIGTASAPFVLALIAGYVYDVRPIVHDVCEALLPFGSVVIPQQLPQPTEQDAGATR